MTLVAQITEAVTGEVVSKVKTFLLVIAAAGMGICAFMMGNQAIAAFTYERSVATIIASGYRCQTSKAWRDCDKAEIDLAEARGGEIIHEFRVTFTFPDAKGVKRQISGYITKTGLPREEAVHGAQFNILYDPADPKKTSLPLGADHHAIFVGLAGLAALAFYVFLFGLPSWPRRRTDDVYAS